MSSSYGPGRPPPNEKAGRIFLASISVVLIVAGILKSGELAGIPLILFGVLLAILSAFHPRVRGVKISNKIELPIAAEHRAEEFERERSRPLPPPSRPSLGDISRAAHDPATRRRRLE